MRIEEVDVVICSLSMHACRLLDLKTCAMDVRRLA